MDFLKTMFENEDRSLSILKIALGKSIEHLQNRKQKPENTLMFVNGKSTDGGNIFVYVLVDGDKLEPFLTARNKTPFFPEQFGKIIESGYGNPSLELRERIESQYGFRHQDMNNLTDNV